MKSLKRKEITGVKLSYNVAQQRKYKVALRKLVDRMTQTTKRELMKLFKSGLAKEYFAQDESLAGQAKILLSKLTTTFEGLFNRAARPLAKKVFSGAERTSRTALNASVRDLGKKLTLKGNVIPEGKYEIIEAAIKPRAKISDDVEIASVAQNTDLIKSIPEQYFKDISGIVMRAITTGQGAKTIAEHLQKQEGMVNRRATLIAYDQTRKVYTAVNKERMQALGLTKFKWLHSGGGQTPRPDHVKMDGNIYRFDDPPIIDRNTGERGFPGDAVNCRCTMAAVLEFEDDEK